eukprot:6580463-Alexandrium_andersonii.AAC.1
MPSVPELLTNGSAGLGLTVRSRPFVLVALGRARLFVVRCLGCASIALASLPMLLKNITRDMLRGRRGTTFANAWKSNCASASPSCRAHFS